MNILFLNDDFFYYDKAIKSQFEKMGHKVDSYVYKKNVRFYEVYFASVVDKTSDVLSLERTQREILRKLKKRNINYDVVLVTSGQEILPNTLIELREAYCKAKFVWFLWDNICNIGQFDNLKCYYDEIVSFDEKEAKEYGYIPLNDFFVKDIGLCGEDKIYDLSYVGTYNERRANIISEVLRKYPSYNTSISLFEFKANGVRAFIKQITGKTKKKSPWSVYKKIKYEDYIDIIKKSKCVLDISYENQTGLSMRVYEALGFETKIISTNKSIKYKDFYNSNNIMLLDPDDIKILDSTFLETPYESVPNDILKKYSIEYWCEEMERIFVQ